MGKFEGIRPEADHVDAVVSRHHGLERKQLAEMRELIGEVRRSLSMIGVAPLPNQPRPAQSHLLLRLAIFGAFYPNYYIQVSATPQPLLILKGLSSEICLAGSGMI